MEIELGSENVRSVGQLIDGMCIRQSFFPAAPVLLTVAVLMTRVPFVDYGFLHMDIIEMEAELVGGKRYELMLRTLNCRAGMSPLVYGGIASSDGYLFVGSKQERGMELACRMTYGEIGI